MSSTQTTNNTQDIEPSTTPTAQDLQIGEYTVPSHKIGNITLSLHRQFVEKGELSEKQWKLLKNIIGEIEQVLPYSLKTIQLVKVHFYRNDYNGDALGDYDVRYVPNCDFSETITDGQASQYGHSAVVPKYTLYKEVEVLQSLVTEQDINRFLKYQEDFHNILAKIGRNRFKTLKNKNAAICVVNKLIKSDYIDIEDELDQVTGREFKRNLYKRGY